MFLMGIYFERDRSLLILQQEKNCIEGFIQRKKLLTRYLLRLPF